MQKIYYIWNEKFENKYVKDKKYWKVVIIQGKIEVLRIAYII